jgi:hypothetical protein
VISYLYDRTGGVLEKASNDAEMDTMTIAAVMVLALAAGWISGFAGARAEHWDLFRRVVTIDGFLRANAARQGKIAAKELQPLQQLRMEDMTEMDILREAQARGMLHTQQIRRRETE